MLRSRIVLKSLIIYTLLTGTFITHAYTGFKGFNAGKTDTIYVEALGAITASKAWVSGGQVTATILEKELNNVTIKLQVARNATPGLRTLNIQLIGGIKRASFYIFYLKNAKITQVGPTLTGRLQQVKIEMPAMSGRIITPIFSEDNSCYHIGASTGYKYPAGSIDPNMLVHRMDAKRTGNTQSMWATSFKWKRSNTQYGRDAMVKVANKDTHCKLKLYESNPFRPGDVSDIRIVNLSLNRDPDHIVPLPTPVIIKTLKSKTTKYSGMTLNSKSTTTKTKTSTSDSPVLKWQKIKGATRYKVVLTRNGAGYKSQVMTQGSRFSNLPKGRYKWFVIAYKTQPYNSILPETHSNVVIFNNYIQKLMRGFNQNQMGHFTI